MNFLTGIMVESLNKCFQDGSCRIAYEDFLNSTVSEIVNLS